MSRTRAGLAGLAGVLLLAGCGGAAQAALSGAAATVGPTATTPTAARSGAADAPLPVTTDPVPVTAGSTPTPAAAPAPCTAAGLRTSVEAAGGAAGHDDVPLLFTNTGPAACTLTGYPTVRLLTTPGRTPVGPVAAHDPGPVNPMVLATGAHATATLSVARAGLYDEASCRPVSAGALSVVAPGGGAADVVQLAGAVDVCSDGVGQVSVTATAAG